MKLPFFGSSKDKNINLLPEDSGEASGSKRDIVLSLLTPIATLILVGVVFAILFLFEQQQVRINSTLNQQINQREQEWNNVSQVAKDISTVKNNLETYSSHTEKNKDFLSMTKTVQSVIPDGVVLQTLNIDSSGETSLRGESEDPKSILQLLKLIDENKLFENRNLDSIGISGEQVGPPTYTFVVSFTVKAQ